MRFARLIPLLLVAWFVAACAKDEVEPLPAHMEAPVARAKELLKEAGYPDGKGMPTIQILYNTSESHKAVAVEIQSIWRDYLGLDVELVNIEWKTYLQKLDGLDYMVARRGWIADYDDPSTFLDMFVSTDGNNNTGWGSPEFDKLIEEARSEDDPAARMAILSAAEKILMTELPSVPIYFYLNKEMYDASKISGWFKNSLGVHPLHHVAKGDGSGTLTIVNHAEIKTMDPGKADGVPEHRIQLALFEGLMNYDPKGEGPLPGVAKSHEVSDDLRTYTFHLRDDAKWSDGKPVTAGDFEYAWLRVIDKVTASPYHTIITAFVKGAAEYRDGKVGREGVGITVKDDRTLVVELANPCPFFIDLMAFGVYYPVRKDVVEKHGGSWATPGKIVSNGPFRLVEHVENSHLSMEKNPHYWDAANVKQSNVKYLPTEDVNTAFNLYEDGEADVLTDIPKEFAGKIDKRPDFHKSMRLGTYYYSFNVTKKPFDNVLVRRALALSIDRKAIVEKILQNLGNEEAYAQVPTVYQARGFQNTRFDEVGAKE